MFETTIEYEIFTDFSDINLNQEEWFMRDNDESFLKNLFTEEEMEVDAIIECEDYFLYLEEIDVTDLVIC